MTQTEKITGLKGAYLGKNKQFSWHSCAAAAVTQCSKFPINVHFEEVALLDLVQGGHKITAWCPVVSYVHTT